MNAGPRHRFTVEGLLVSNCLSMGYAGGLGAFVQMAAGYNLDLTMLYAIVWPVSPQHHRQAEWMWEYHQSHSADRLAAMEKKYGPKLKEVVLACEVIKLSWRESCPNIVAFWKALEEAWESAIRSPGKVFTAGRVALVYGKTRVGPALRMTLPSGRHIYHHKAKVEAGWQTALEAIIKARAADTPTKKQRELLQALEVMLPGSDLMSDSDLKKELDTTTVFNIADACGRQFGTSLAYYASSSQSGKWAKTYTYGGSLSESAAQGSSRDLLAYNLPAVDEAGFNQLLLVHDETVTEAPMDKTVEELNGILSRVPTWARGIPLSADGYATTGGYKKG